MLLCNRNILIKDQPLFIESMFETSILFINDLLNSWGEIMSSGVLMETSVSLLHRITSVQPNHKPGKTNYHHVEKEMACCPSLVTQHGWAQKLTN